MARPKTGERQVLSARFEPEMVEAIAQLQKGNPDVGDRADVLRLLVRRGMRSVVEDEQLSALPVREELSPDEVRARVEYVVEMLSDLFERVEAANPVMAVRAARAVADPVQAYTRTLEQRHGMTDDD